MANPYSSRVNAKLAYTRALLRLEAGQDSALARAALSQSALMHLHGAWRAYLREVGADYQLRDVESVVSAASLCDSLAAEGKTPSEASELRDLEADRTSWSGRMCQLLEQIDGLSVAARPSSALPAAAVEGRIAVVADPSHGGGVDSATVEALLEAFVALIDRQRGTMVEC